MKLATIACLAAMILLAANTFAGVQIEKKQVVETPNIPNPATILQGGDNIGDAFVINSLPFSDAGTTEGYTDDYAGPCGTNAGAPDVVYSYSPSQDTTISISLCASTNFDSRLYIFENSADNVIACNDDQCGLQSKLDNINLESGNTYYIVIDGFGGQFGSYDMNISAEANSGSIFAPKVDYQALDYSAELCVADLNGDGFNDISVSDEGVDKISVFMNNGDGSFAIPPHNYDTQNTPFFQAAADFDHDGDLDLCVSNYGSSSVSILRNDGIGDFSVRSDITVGDRPFAIAVGDLNGDSAPDIAVTRPNQDSVMVLLNDGLGGFLPLAGYATGSYPLPIVASDIDEDGYLDLVIGNFSSNTITFLLNDGNGNFQVGQPESIEISPCSMAAADLDGDNDIDLAISNQLGGTALVLLNNGGGSAWIHRAFEVIQGQQQRGIVVADFDNDGDIDLAIANTFANNISVLLNDGTALFTLENNYTAGSQPIGFCASDLDNDGYKDLVAANKASYTVSVFKNLGSARIHTGTIIGTVIRADDNSPIWGANVLSLLDTAITDQEGAFVINPFPTRLGSILSVSKTGFITQNITDINVNPGETTSVQVSLIPTARDLSLDLWGERRARPGFDKTYLASYSNLGFDPANNVTLMMVLPQEVTYLSSQPEGSLLGDTLHWDLGVLPADYSAKVYVNINVPEYTLVGTVLRCIAQISTSDPESLLVNNYASDIDMVVNSWDPNDKKAEPIGVGENKFIRGDEKLKYTIFFENDGTGEAVNVAIIDTLDPKLDWSTVIFGPMSHPGPCSSYFDPGSGVISWACDSIMLPPDTANQANEGWVTFEAYPRGDASSGTVISNRAAIKFDFNPWLYAPMDSSYVIRTVDRDAPQTRVKYLPAVISTDTFTVEWTGMDNFLGSGIESYKIYVSVDSGSYDLWRSAPGNESHYLFQGTLGNRYDFYSVGIDSVGNIEAPPESPDVAIFLGGCQYIPGDINGNSVANGIDIVYAVNYLKGGPHPPTDCGGICPEPSPFYAAGDVNGNCAFNGIDITFFVRYLKGQVPSLLYCPDCPPASMAPPVPSVQPIRAPFLKSQSDNIRQQ